MSALARTTIEPMCSQMPSSRAKGREVLERRIALLRQRRREQALALELHQRRDLGRLDVIGALAGRLADQRGCVANVALDIASRAHLHEADAKRAGWELGFVIGHGRARISCRAAGHRACRPGRGSMEIVAAADVALSDPNLRHRVAPAGLGAHLGPQLRPGP